jgi:DNA-directed RNA polymerase specialized sigma subunit
MQIMQSYNDLTRMIELMRSQVELLEGEQAYWWWVGDKPGKGFMEYDLSVTSKKFDNIQEQLRQANKILDFYETVKADMDKHIHSLEGLEFKIAYKRFVENKTYKEIAKELKYSYDYVRQVASRHKLTINSHN